jgi:hypothetical protein
MELNINNRPIESYFSENYIAQTCCTCIKYYVGTAAILTSQCALMGGYMGGCIGLSVGVAISLAPPAILSVMCVKYLKS